eukprot:s3076_g20.t1
MASEGGDAEVLTLQAALAEVEEAFRLEQRGLEEANGTLLRVQQDRRLFQPSMDRLDMSVPPGSSVCRSFNASGNSRKRPYMLMPNKPSPMIGSAAACAAEQQRLNELNEKVRQLRECLAKQPQAHQVVEEAVAKVERDTQQRSDSQQLQWEAKQQEMDQKLEVAEVGKLIGWLIGWDQE